jgi:predicted Fe-S protein YdhL (DUF1289 family)
MSPISSPCRNICELHDDVCIGCRRSLEEIAAWAGLSEAERRRIMAELDRRPEPRIPR